MDSSRFAQFARSLNALRTRRAAVAALGAVFGAPALAVLDTDARKKKKKHHSHKRKKPCAKKCGDGCCTSTFGTCVRPGSQSSGQCGAGGEICRSTGCAGGRCSAANPCPEGECCDGDGACGPCLAFVTSTLHNGDLGGLDGADAVCQDLADGAGLPGVYMAWLSDSTGSPADRFMRATAPYTLRGGPVIANDWDELTSGELSRALNKTEQGTGGALSSKVWTNTASDGTARTDTPKSCSNWSSSSAGATGYDGMLSSISATWTARDESTCNSTIRLYCFQQA